MSTRRLVLLLAAVLLAAVLAAFLWSPGSGRSGASALAPGASAPWPAADAGSVSSQPAATPGAAPSTGATKLERAEDEKAAAALAAEGVAMPPSPIRAMLDDANVLGRIRGTGPNGLPREVALVRVEGGKYPLLRVVTTTGEGDTTQREVMVADHWIVKKPDAMSESDFRSSVTRLGYAVRKKMLGPGLFIVAVPSGADSAELLAGFDRSMAELGTLGRAEPDYVVEAFSAPNDPYAHMLWGMDNPTGTVVVNSGTAAGTTMQEAGKISYAGPLAVAGVTGNLVACGYGAVAGDFPPAVAGNIALIERGGAGGATVTFATKVGNAKAAGAIAVVLYNNVPGGFSGTLNAFGDWLPVVPLTQADGQALLSALPAAVTVRAEPSGKDISAPAAWAVQTGSADVLVGVIDTGIDYTHPDLAANIWVNPGETGTDTFGRNKATNGVDDDANGFIDDVRGWDFANDDSDPMDDNNHGTHCAGTVGALGNNTVGVVGAAWSVRMAAIKFLNANGSGFTSDGIDAVYYGTRIGARITSNSWGGSSFVSALRDAIQDAHANGSLFVAAAGNSATAAPNYPAGYDSPNIISVAATDSTDRLASFSNFGLPHVDMAAPGVGILSTLPVFRSPAYAFLNGTSMACPHVSGVAALLLSQAPGMTHLEVRERLLATVDPVFALSNVVATGGRLNAAAALEGISDGPVIGLDSVAVTDPSPGGNADGVANPGETVQLAVLLRNDGFSATANLTGVLSTADPRAEILDAACAFGAVPRRGTAASQDALSVRLDPATPSPTSIAFQLTLTGLPGGPVELPLTLRVSDSHPVSGVVTLDGGALAGATVLCRGTADRTVTTAADGTYSFALPAGEFTVSAELASDELSRTEAVAITLPGAAGNVDFALTTATIAGTVLDHADSSPVGGARVTFLGPGHPVATTTPDGTFSLTRIYGRPVVWKVSASAAPRFRHASPAVSVPAPPGNSSLVFRLGPPGVAFDAGGLPGYAVALSLGPTTTRTITITNTGVADLDWQFSGIAAGGGTRGALLGEFNAPSAITSRPEGSAYDGQFLYWLDSGMLYQQSLAGAMVTQWYLPELIAGFKTNWRLALFDGQHFWFEEFLEDPTDTNHLVINLHALDLAQMQIVRTVEVDRRLHVSKSSGEGITWGNARCGGLGDGAFWFYWAKYDTAIGQRRIDMARIDPASGALMSSFRLPDQVNYPQSNFDFNDFTYANGALWVVRSQQGIASMREIYKIHPTTGAVLATVTPPATTPASRHYEVLMDETGALWVWNDNATPRVVRRIDSGDRLWMTSDDTIGTLAPGQSTTLTITFDASVVAAGVYQGAARISTNDPKQPNVFVPLVMNVTAGTPGNSPPTITASSPASPHTMDEGTSQVFSLTANDPNADTMTRQWAVDGVVQAGGTTSFTYSPDFASAGAHAVAVRVSDAKGGVATRMWQVRVNNVNRAPVAQDATYTVANTDTLPLKLVATDADNEALEFTLVAPPASGTLTGRAPDLVFRPAAGFSGPVTLQFKASDGQAESNIATVTIEVGFRRLEVPDAPINQQAAFGARPTRTITVRNTGTTPLRWSATMVADVLPSAAGTQIGTIGPLVVPTGTDFGWWLSGLDFDGTHLVSSVVELSSGAFFRAQVVRYDPATGAMVGPVRQAPSTSSSEYMWIELMSSGADAVLHTSNESSFVGENLSTRLHDFTFGETAMNLVTMLPQVPTDFGGFNYGLARGPDGLWFAVGATTSESRSGLYRLRPGTKEVLDRFPLPFNQGWAGGPVIYGNGAIWMISRLGFPALKVNPFNGEVLATVPMQAFIDPDEAESDRAGAAFLKEGRTIRRVHLGDYLVMSPDGGTLAPGAETTVTVAFDTQLAGAGQHTGDILVLSDDPENPSAAIPYTFQVTTAEDNNLPQITSAAPAELPGAAARDLLTFSVAATDADGDALTYRWLVDGVRQPLADNRTMFEFMVPVAVATKTVSVEVDDGRGGIATRSWQFPVTVPPVSVSASATPDRGTAPLVTSLRALLAGGNAQDGAVEGKGALVVVEAEDFHASSPYSPGAGLADWYATGIPGFEGAVGDAMQGVLSGLASPRPWAQSAGLSYDIQFAVPGTYHLWMRVRSDTDLQNSCLVGWNGAQVGGAFDDSDGGPHRVFRWVRHTATFPVDAGVQRFEIRVAESDYYVDRFLFTTDASFVPEEVGPLYSHLRLPAATFAWNFGDGSASVADSATSHVFSLPGVYTAVATATSHGLDVQNSVQIVAQTTYAAWTADKLSGRSDPERLPSANPDGDAFDNALEYALGLDPTSADSQGAVERRWVEKEGTRHLALRYRRDPTSGGLDLRVEVCGHLGSWSWNAPGATFTEVVEVLSHEDGTESVTEQDLVPIPTAPRRFIRLRAILTE